MAVTYTLAPGAGLLPRRAPQEPGDFPDLLRSLALSGFQHDTPERRYAYEYGRGYVDQGVHPSPDVLPLRLVAAGEQLAAVLADLFPTLGAAEHLLPAGRPSPAEAESLANRLSSPNPPSTGAGDGPDYAHIPAPKHVHGVDHYPVPAVAPPAHTFKTNTLQTVFTADWPITPQTAHDPAPSQLVHGRPDRIGEGYVQPWVYNTVETVLFYVDLCAQRQAENYLARAVLATKMPTREREHWSQVRYQTKSQMPIVLGNVTARLTTLFYALQGSPALVAQYTKHAPPKHTTPHTTSRSI